MSEKIESPLQAAITEAAGQNVAECYQCGKCTAGCPMARYMDITPSQIMRLAQIGDARAEQKLLTSTAIWSCVGCLTCAQRCPKELDPAAVIDVLREMSNVRQLVSPAQKKVLAFHKAFLKTVETTGRMSEFPLVRRYKLASMDLFSDVMMVPPMLARGKLPLTSHTVKGRDEIKKIFQACRKRGPRR